MNLLFTTTYSDQSGPMAAASDQGTVDQTTQPRRHRHYPSPSMFPTVQIVPRLIRFSSILAIFFMISTTVLIHSDISGILDSNLFLGPSALPSTKSSPEREVKYVQVNTRENNQLKIVPHQTQTHPINLTKQRSKSSKAHESTRVQHISVNKTQNNQQYQQVRKTMLHQTPRDNLQNKKVYPARNIPSTSSFTFTLPGHCSSSKRGEIVIRGERHSGTNFLQNILTRNLSSEESKVAGYQNKNYPRSKYGWKHGFLYPIGINGEPFDVNDTLIVLSRDVFTWLPKMFEHPYDPIMGAKTKDGFSSFIRAAYSNGCNANKETKQAKAVCESAENTIQIREQKYKQWLSEDPDPRTYKGSKEGFLQSRIHVRLESIETHPNDNAVTKKRQEKFIRDPILERCIKIKGDVFEPVTEYRKYLESFNREHNKINPSEERMKMLEKYSRDDLKFVLSQLDMDFEKKIGYDYGYIYDVLKE